MQDTVIEFLINCGLSQEQAYIVTERLLTYFNVKTSEHSLSYSDFVELVSRETNSERAEYLISRGFGNAFAINLVNELFPTLYKSTSSF